MFATLSQAIFPNFYLQRLYRQAPEAAVRLADQWGSEPFNLNRYLAAADLMKVQTVFPACDYCKWALVSQHSDCEKVLSLYAFPNHILRLSLQPDLRTT